MLLYTDGACCQLEDQGGVLSVSGWENLPDLGVGILPPPRVIEKSHVVVQAYATGGAESDVVDLDCGLPQGTSLGPLKFTVYRLHSESMVRDG